nr:MobA/MobL family protein [Roseomonas harenae]
MFFHCHHDTVTKSHAAGLASAKWDYIRRDSSDPLLITHNIPDGVRGVTSFLNGREEYVRRRRRESRIVEVLEVALPNEGSDAAHLQIAEAIIQDITGGACPVAASLHRKRGNIHLHILVVDEDIRGRREGEPHTGGRFFAYSEPGSTQRLRLTVAGSMNRVMPVVGLDVEVDPRTLEEQRKDALARGDLGLAAELDRLPTIHIGPNAVAMERKGKLRDKERLAEARRRKAAKDEALQEAQRLAQTLAEPPPSPSLPATKAGRLPAAVPAPFVRPVIAPVMPKEGAAASAPSSPTSAPSFAEQEPPAPAPPAEAILTHRSSPPRRRLQGPAR